MALTFSVTTPTGGTSTFAKMAMGEGKFCAGFTFGAPNIEIIRHHIRGVAGNVTVRDKRSGLMFVCQMLYCNATEALVYAAAATDAGWWATEAATLVDAGGYSYSNCNMIPGSFRIIRFGSTGDGKCEILAACQFTWDS